MMIQHFGFKPVCPMGGKYSIDKETGEISNSIFGSQFNPHINYKKINGDILKRYFSTEEIKVELEFTEEGIKTKIRTR